MQNKCRTCLKTVTTDTVPMLEYIKFIGTLRCEDCAKLYKNNTVI